MSGSGPPYPPPALNAIGSFRIGVSPIGTMPPFSYWATVLPQYANSPILTALIDFFSQCVDQIENFDDFFDDVWNVDTATGWGLDVWGRIVGVSRNLEVSTVAYLGFEEAEPGSNPWNQGVFYLGNPLTSVYALSDDAFRQLILAKAYANICDGSIKAINQVLMTLFGSSGNCYVTDGSLAGAFFGFEEANDPDVTGFGGGSFYSGGGLSPMTMAYTFTFVPSPVQLAIIENSGVLPKPVGVAASVVIL